MTELDLKLRESQELECGLFVDITINYCGRDYVVRKDYYTVKDNEVYSINIDGSLYKSGDSLSNVLTQCHRIGKYKAACIYPINPKAYSYKQLLKLLHL